MNFINFTKLGRALSLTAAAAVFAAGAAGAQDSLSVVFFVNVDATVRAVAGLGAPDGAAPVQISVTGGEEAVLRLPKLQTIGVAYFGVPGQANAYAIVSNRTGKVTVNAPMESYKNAEVLLYTVNGKRILRQRVSASSAGNNVISCSNIATGAYLLVVNGTDGHALTSRITHGGGGLDISVAFGNVNGSENNTVSTLSLAKKTATVDWMITVSANGYLDSVYTLLPVEGVNLRQNITLRAAPGSGGSYESVVIGGNKWMKKNLNVETTDSWCYEKSADSCAKYGRLYTWSAAKSACQSVGWRLPDTADWRRLVDAAGGQPVAGKVLKSTSGWKDNNFGGSGNGTDVFGFSALPAGLRTTGGVFRSTGIYGYWWTATEQRRGYAYERDIDYRNDGVYGGTQGGETGGGYSVRCVADE